MSRRGDCDDNAVMESFFSTVKSELADRFASFSEAEMELFDYIEVFYNQRRQLTRIRDRLLNRLFCSGARGYELPTLLRPEIERSEEDRFGPRGVGARPRRGGFSDGSGLEVDDILVAEVCSHEDFIRVGRVHVDQGMAAGVPGKLDSREL
jgi:hypothetical protein